MKITTLVAAAALATVSTTAIAQNVTTADGEVVMIEKEAAFGILAFAPAAFAAVIAIIASNSGTE